MMVQLEFQVSRLRMKFTWETHSSVMFHVSGTHTPGHESTLPRALDSSGTKTTVRQGQDCWLVLAAQLELVPAPLSPGVVASGLMRHKPQLQSAPMTQG